MSLMRVGCERNENFMHDVFMAKVGAVAAMSKAVLPPLAVVIAEANGVITEHTAVPLTLVVGISGACWYLQGRFTRIEDSIAELNRTIVARPCHHCPPTLNHKPKYENEVSD